MLWNWFSRKSTPIAEPPPPPRDIPVASSWSTERAAAVEEAVRIIQEHLDNEARNRRQSAIQPRDLCPAQKAALVQDLHLSVPYPTGR